MKRKLAVAFFLLAVALFLGSFVVGYIAEVIWPVFLLLGLAVIALIPVAVILKEKT
jgi:hypothetical protein